MTGRRRLYYELTRKGVAATRAQREAIQGLLLPGTNGPSAQELARMREGLRECAALSAFILDLRRRTLEAAPRRGKP